MANTLNKLTDGLHTRVQYSSSAKGQLWALSQQESYPVITEKLPPSNTSWSPCCQSRVPDAAERYGPGKENGILLVSNAHSSPCLMMTNFEHCLSRIPEEASLIYEADLIIVAGSRRDPEYSLLNIPPRFRLYLILALHNRLTQRSWVRLRARRHR